MAPPPEAVESSPAEERTHIPRGDRAAPESRVRTLDSPSPTPATWIQARREAPADGADPLIGQVPLGQYRILSKIGEGGFGAVYLAEQLGVGRKAVIKVAHREFAADEVFVKRFEREAKVLAMLDHHHLVKLYNAGELEDGALFLALEYGGDRTLAHELRSVGGRLPAARVLRIGAQICEALAEAHARGVVHRDLKPANVLVGTKDSADWIKVVDVGIAKLLEIDDDAAKPTDLTRGFMIGTPAYFSPEQAKAMPVDGRSDLYSLGILLYELLTGELPISATTPAAFVVAHTVDKPIPFAQWGVQVPRAVERIILRALEKDPARRFQTALEMRDALVAAQAGLSSHRRPALLAAVATASVALAVGAFLLAHRKPVRLAQAPVQAVANKMAPAVQPVPAKPATPTAPTPTPPVEATGVPPPNAVVTQQSAAPSEPVPEKQPESLSTPRRGKRKRAAAGLVEPSATEPEEKADLVTGMIFARIPGGSFHFGCEPQDPNCFDDENPGRTVQTASFWLARTDTTVAAYSKCFASGACTDPGTGAGCNWKSGRDDHPINCVDWNQATAFCKWIGARLPTAEEWEFAAKGGGSRIYPWGDPPWTVRRANLCDRRCHQAKPDLPLFDDSGDDGYASTSPVGAFPDGAGRWGLLDLAGNVWQWTASDYRAPSKEVRGGGWSNVQRNLRASGRSRQDPAWKSSSLGFRCAR